MKLLIYCAEHDAKHENKYKSEKKIIWQMIFEWRYNLRFNPSSNDEKYASMGPQTKFPDFSLILHVWL